MINNKGLIYLISFLAMGLSFATCKAHYFRSNYKDVNTLMHSTDSMKIKPFLKAHMKNGDICILNGAWLIDTVTNMVSGKGTRYDFNREEKYQGKMSVPIDSVSIFETNKKLINPESGRIRALSILAGVDVAIGILCITNPKACFGSCPTFYQNEMDDFHFADAEGFSNAILPSMEYFDVDALNNTPLKDHHFSIAMKNEALETHCVNDVKLLAVPRQNGERVYQSSTNQFYVCKNNYAISKAKAEEGDITHLLDKQDRTERFSLSDHHDLSSKEEIILDFDNINDSKDVGLVVNFRQTMMTTYLFYSAMGFMGDNVGDLFAKLEQDKDLQGKFDGTTKELGGIQVHAWNQQKGKWVFQNEFSETGPIAINRQILPLSTQSSGTKVKLKITLNKGLWRIDNVFLTNILQKVTPLEITATSILNKGKLDNQALQAINNTDKHLISMPGDEFKFNFELPTTSNDYELFLYSKGYYLEWMRSHWIKDKNLLKLKEMVISPKTFLKSEAAEYKKYESTMEETFWGSKIDTKTFSYYEK